jgi:hypothetical protein
MHCPCHKIAQACVAEASKMPVPLKPASAHHCDSCYRFLALSGWVVVGAWTEKWTVV